MVLTHLGDADSLVGLLATKGPLWKNDNFYTDFSVVGQKNEARIGTAWYMWYWCGSTRPAQGVQAASDLRIVYEPLGHL